MYRYDVVGLGTLPADMVHYDQANVVDGQPDHNHHGRWIYAIEGKRKPTVARWSCFGWQVQNVRTVDPDPAPLAAKRKTMGRVLGGLLLGMMVLGAAFGDHATTSSSNIPTSVGAALDDCAMTRALHSIEVSYFKIAAAEIEVDILRSAPQSEINRKIDGIESMRRKIYLRKDNRECATQIGYLSTLADQTYNNVIRYRR